MSVTADREDSRHEERCEGPVAAVRKARAGLAVLLLLACGESPAQNASASGDASRQEVEQPADGGDAPPTDDVAVDGSLGDASSDAADPGLLPLLPPGSHIGTIIGFEPLPAGTKASIDANWADAVPKGMDIARVQIDWAQ